MLYDDAAGDGMTPQIELSIGELDRSIIALSKRKLKLLQEVEQINLNISHLRQQQEQLCLSIK